MPAQCLRRGFAETRPVLQGKATELVEPVVGCNGGDRRRFVLGGAEGLPDALQPLVHEIALGALLMNVRKRVAQGPFADADCLAQGRDGDRIVQVAPQYFFGVGHDPKSRGQETTVSM